LKIKKVRSDFRNSRMDELCDDIRIKHELSAKYAPQSNEFVKRKNRTLIYMKKNPYLVSKM
jgi:transposase InsO family protein